MKEVILAVAIVWIVIGLYIFRQANRIDFWADPIKWIPGQNHFTNFIYSLIIWPLYAFFAPEIWIVPPIPKRVLQSTEPKPNWYKRIKAWRRRHIEQWEKNLASQMKDRLN